MAKKSRVIESGLNVDLLAEIAKGSLTHISKDDGLPLLQHDPKLIEVNIEQLDSSGNAAVRLTEAGIAMVTNGAGVAKASETKSSLYAVISNAVLPPSKRGNKGGGAPTQYPFDSLEIGQSFFVPVSEKHPDPVKTLGSTVSSANMRFAVATGETKTVTRAKRGEKNRAVKDAAGNKVMETVTVPVHKMTRRFAIRAVKKGETYGTWTAEANGALIARVNLKETD